jgi:hypothetical protein
MIQRFSVRFFNARPLAYSTSVTQYSRCTPETEHYTQEKTIATTTTFDRVQRIISFPLGVNSTDVTMNNNANLTAARTGASAGFDTLSPLTKEA